MGANISGGEAALKSGVSDNQYVSREQILSDATAGRIVNTAGQTMRYGDTLAPASSTRLDSFDMRALGRMTTEQYNSLLSPALVDANTLAIESEKTRRDELRSNMLAQRNVLGGGAGAATIQKSKLG